MTIYSIDQKISSYYKKISQYNVFSTNLDTLKSNIKSACSYLSIASDYLKSGLTIDGVCVDESKLDGYSSDLSDNISKIDSIQSSISTSIVELNSKITFLKEERARLVAEENANKTSGSTNTKSSKNVSAIKIKNQGAK
ncbi:MAG TPA: hypothetical protein PLC53_01880 [Bacilli bacterium]|nr:hypothetical protein [Bacilli bacterium]